MRLCYCWKQQIEYVIYDLMAIERQFEIEALYAADGSEELIGCCVYDMIL